MGRKGTKYDNARPSRPKKRKFCGNQYTSENNTSRTRASAEKIAKQDANFEVNVDQSVRYYIINFALFLTLQETLICKSCKKDVKFSKRAEKGLGFQLAVQCECEDDTYIPSSPQIDHSYEINRRFVFAMRMLGVGLQGIINFLGLMDIGGDPIVSKNVYCNIVDHIWIAASAVAKMVFQKAAREEQEKNEGDSKNHLSVSAEGSWTKRGFSSLIDVTSLIGKFSGKIIDLIVNSSVCKACERWAGKEDTAEYDGWYETHSNECSANRAGNAGTTEAKSVIEMFKRSVEFFKVYYKYYIGDGDAKTFKLLQEAEPYGDDLKVEKEESVLHIKKRMCKDLSSDELSQRCIGAYTRNNNKSYNECIWQISPKHTFAGKKVVEIAAYCAACVFNEGFKPLLKIMETMGVSVGEKAVALARRQDESRFPKSNPRSSECSEEQRVALRNAGMEADQSYEEVEGIMYGIVQS